MEPKFTKTQRELLQEALSAYRAGSSASVTHGWHKGETGKARTTHVGARRDAAANKLKEQGVIEQIDSTRDSSWKRSLTTDFYRLTPEWAAKLAKAYQEGHDRTGPQSLPTGAEAGAANQGLIDSLTDDELDDLDKGGW